MPEPLTFEDDDRLPGWGLGVTNLIARPTRGIDTLRAEEYARGLAVLRRKVRRWKPRVVTFVGVTLYRFIFDVRPGQPITPGFQIERFEGARVAVVPNPSGRNAHFSYVQMLQAFQTLRDARPGSRR